ncbi:MAG: TlpA family protein disulfide reductase [Candidatus Hydrogenedentes bacterium]|nr:TlpA family protein disulfide reductase [Candidatus Hydrogenedentota bacterium]
MRKVAILFLAGVAVVFFCDSILGARLGDPAQKLQIKEWVKNGPVELEAGKGKNIFVVEFWATWCPPCRRSIPHLTELQQKYRDKDVVIVGVSMEEPSDVKPFVEKMGDKMNYAVAIDDAYKTYAGYMEAYGAPGIPWAFVVDKRGNLVWQGSPLDDLESVIKKVIVEEDKQKGASKPERGDKK